VCVQPAHDGVPGVDIDAYTSRQRGRRRQYSTAVEVQQVSVGRKHRRRPPTPFLCVAYPWTAGHLVWLELLRITAGYTSFIMCDMFVKAQPSAATAAAATAVAAETRLRGQSPMLGGRTCVSLVPSDLCFSCLVVLPSPRLLGF